MVSWFRIRREWLLLVTVKCSRLWLLDGFSRPRLASNISLTASCPVLWFGSGLFLSGAVSWFFIVKSLRLTPKFSFHSKVNGLLILDNRICWGDSRESLVVSGQQIVIARVRVSLCSFCSLRQWAWLYLQVMEASWQDVVMASTRFLARFVAAMEVVSLGKSYFIIVLV